MTKRTILANKRSQQEEQNNADEYVKTLSKCLLKFFFNFSMMVQFFFKLA